MQNWSPTPVNFTLSKSLHSPKVVVWCAVGSNFLIQPFFFQSTVTGENYEAMLRTHLLPQLHVNDPNNSIVFQHDGAPPHFARNVTQFLNDEEISHAISHLLIRLQLIVEANGAIVESLL